MQTGCSGKFGPNLSSLHHKHKTNIAKVTFVWYLILVKTKLAIFSMHTHHIL